MIKYLDMVMTDICMMIVVVKTIRTMTTRTRLKRKTTGRKRGRTREEEKNTRGFANSKQGPNTQEGWINKEVPSGSAGFVGKPAFGGESKPLSRLEKKDRSIGSA
eukprot:7580453-Pyramimonas_sp.AAC.1